MATEYLLGEDYQGSTVKELLSMVGLEAHYDNKLKLSDVLEINAKTVSDEPLKTMPSLPGAFLKKLMMADVNARDVQCVSTDQEVAHYGLDNLENSTDNNINPTDLMTSLFLCSDSFLQQELVLKMSLCQFAVPLLLPNCDTEQSTLMLWALRDIVKKFRNSSQSASKSLIEERVVNSEIPMVSFVRLGESSLSKSQTLNKLLSNPQEYHDTFVHYDMECGDAPRIISNGLVEMSWYLPLGDTTTDRFNTPVAVANLRGDIRSFDKQFSFLCQTSTAVYIFSDDLPAEADLDIVKNNVHTQADVFLIVNSKRKTFKDTVVKFTKGGGIKTENVIYKKKQNDAEFVKSLRSCVSASIKNSSITLTVEQMADVAQHCGILVDEDDEDCRKAKKMSDEITSTIAKSDTLTFKNEHLPLQGKILKELSQLEKETCSLRNVGENDIEHYKSSLKEKERKLRKEQQKHDMSVAMMYFVHGLHTSGVQRSYFLKWMRIGLDNISRKSLSGLRDEYKEICQKTPQDKKAIADLDREISDCSLGVEHFLRELGQLYESASSLPKDSEQWKQMQPLPGLCAQMLLDGFPIELVDGDASNVPLTWISAVLIQLNDLVGSNSKIKVVTVLGVQSTGKSTLLNTMFGVRFAVSSGRCTRGAFMLLIKADKDVKEELKCDYIMVIDTEGLKSPELAQLDGSHEHDNELATLVIGLSDVTIINIAMENSTEMKDILQIVVQAFIRMKELGKKPICHFVQQNVSDMSAHDNNMRDRKKLLEQLDEMTVAAAKMEKKENITRFTDVMEYDPDTNSCYIPGLWHGTPPMAPVNAGYSKAVYDFKKRLIQDLKKCQKNVNVLDFKNWTQNLCQSVKFEKFIFSFRNSLVADAYTRLCIEYNEWEWAFQKNMYAWMVTAENKISNSMMDTESENSIGNTLSELKSEAFTVLSIEENKIQDNLEKYFAKKDGHVSLVERYKADFVNSAKTRRRETENRVKNKLQEAFEIKNAMAEVDKIKRSQARIMEEKVLGLLKHCRQRTHALSDTDLKEEFETMWEKCLSEINFRGLPGQDVATVAFSLLRENLSTRAAPVNEMLVTHKLVDCGISPFQVESTSVKKQITGYIRHMDKNHYQKKIQEFCDHIITLCNLFVTQKMQERGDFHDTYIKELLEIIDTNKRDVLTEECEVRLKQHICGKAALKFQHMHGHFINVNDPRKCLEQSKSKYSADFIDLFHERDQCQRKAEDFTVQCLRTGVLDYVTKRIGPDIMDEVNKGEGSEHFSTRTAFQFKVLEQLLTKEDYELYHQYINNYEPFVKEWLFDIINDKMSKDGTLKNLEKKLLSDVVEIINSAIANARETIGTENNIKTFIHTIRGSLREELVMPQHDLDAITRLNTANTDTEKFAGFLIESVKEMKLSLATEYDEERDISKKLKALPFKPQDQMFTKLFGCGKQCPFCKTPCEAGGEAHTTHFSSIHRPKDLCGVHNVDSKELVIHICSSSVISERKFIHRSVTGKDGHPYKDYQKYYPDWSITGDVSVESTEYWKYVMKEIHNRIAKEKELLPANIPADWETLTKDEAMKSLKKSFNMN